MLRIPAAAGGLPPLVAMLSSPCQDSQVHASCALWHLSMIAEHKPKLIGHGIVPLIVALLAHGTPQAQRHSASILFQLAASTEATSPRVAAEEA